MDHRPDGLLGHAASEGLDLCRALLFRHPVAANQIIANPSGWKLL
jgi:hypothetical protein